ncbi:XRE family transcriptional regulator [Phyllobacterium salinisoli]|uniref:XRE family transcriptional regulator n=1 Tax=Phyllobacterium salinisoli TaxID=1899321 RepID=A0A368JX32_9HYPH|nr:XRE family transcriptional regulator [Phyllobacterium salinisoli]RCS21511.1 XRE family transcriptional regulator [Phyllobacterium salinisoli]
MSIAKTAAKPGHGADRVAAPNIAFSAKLPRKAAFEKALIKQYGEAVRLSKEAGHSVSFRVVVDPKAGAQTISLVEEQPNAFPVEQTGELSDELKAALKEARERGKKRVSEILAADDMLTAEAFADLLGVSRVTVNTRRQSGQVLGLDGAKRGFRFPAWQLDDDGRPFEALPALQEILGGSAWAVYKFLVTPQGSLNGQTGLDALRSERPDEAVEAAKGIAHGDFR